MGVYVNRLAAFTSAAALGFAMLGPVSAFAAEATPAKTSVRIKKEDKNIAAARKNIHDAKNPKRAGELALKDLSLTNKAIVGYLR